MVAIVLRPSARKDSIAASTLGMHGFYRREAAEIKVLEIYSSVAAESPEAARPFRPSWFNRGPGDMEVKVMAHSLVGKADMGRGLAAQSKPAPRRLFQLLHC
jgi:hypothetical protein